MATFSNGESGLSVRTKINDVLQHMDGTSGTLVINEAGADVDIRVESDTNTNAIYMDGATGNVGIGTGVPNAPLTVNNQADNSTVAVLHAGGGTPNRGLKVSTFTNVNQNAGVLLDAQTTIGGATLAFANAGTERMRITAAGDVGIGTAAPTARLDIDAGNMRFADGWGPVWGASPNQPYISGSKASNFINFGVNGSERMRITTAGDVGIGTSAPVGRLDVATTSAALNNGIFFVTPDASGANNGARLGLRYAANSTVRASLGLVFEDLLNNFNAYMTFSTGTSATPNVERMRITAAGDVGFGTATPTNFGAGYINVTAFASNAAVFEARSGLGPTLRVQADNLLGFIDMNSNHPLVFRTNALERMRISAAGDIGIGVSPSGNYTIQGASNFNTGFKGANFGGASVGSSGSGYPLVGYNVRFSATGDTYTYNASDFANAIAFRSGQFQFFNAASGTAGAALAFTQAMTLDTNGDLALGATGSATFRLHLASGSANKLRLFNSVGSGNMIDFVDQVWQSQIEGSAGNLVFRTGGTAERMRIDINGNVGIGTNSPNAASIIDAQSTTKGVRFPNMTTTQKNAMANVAGNVIFDTTLGKLCVNTGSGWQTITSA
jgi:hypothetical protein